MYNSGKALYFAGPVPFLLSYIVMGTVIYSVLVPNSEFHNANNKITIGEMVSFLPLPGAWFALSNRTISPSLVYPFISKITFLGFRMWMDILVYVR